MDTKRIEELCERLRKRIELAGEKPNEYRYESHSGDGGWGYDAELDGRAADAIERLSCFSSEPQTKTTDSLVKETETTGLAGELLNSGTSAYAHFSSHDLADAIIVRAPSIEQGLIDEVRHRLLRAADALGAQGWIAAKEPPVVAEHVGGYFWVVDGDTVELSYFDGEDWYNPIGEGEVYGAVRLWKSATPPSAPPAPLEEGGKHE